MASIINAATSGGLITTADTSGILQLQTAGTTAVTVDASQNVTVVGSLTAAGLSGPHNGTVGATTPSTVVATTVKASTTMGVGGATPSASGSGITFPATQSASTDANTLDDYEEGTWTPTATAGSGSITSSTSEATYIKIGRQVTVRAAIKLTNPGSAGGLLFIAGYPFTSYNYTDDVRASTFLVREDAQTGTAYQGFIDDNSTQGRVATMTNTAISWTTDSHYVFQATYHTAS